MCVLTDRVAKGLASVGGAGLAPWAPGTIGSLVALPIAWMSAHVALAWWWLGILLLGAIGVWASDRVARSGWAEDDGRIVIDELVGTMIAVSWVDRSDPALLLLGFALFRWFDIRKPPPIRQVEEHVPGGLGVMLDDVVAGLAAGMLLVGVGAVGLW